jgi:hypothetical protein
VLAGAPLLATTHFCLGLAPAKLLYFLFSSHPEPIGHYSGELLWQARARYRGVFSRLNSRRG